LCGKWQNGLAIFPLPLLMGSTFSDCLTREFPETNKVISFGAGAVALFGILEDPESARPLQGGIRADGFT